MSPVLAAAPAWAAIGVGLVLLPVGAQRGTALASLRGGATPRAVPRGASARVAGESWRSSASVAVLIVVAAVVLLGPARGLVVGAPGAAAAVVALRRAARRPPRVEPDRSLALALDLAAAALHGGRPVGTALALAAPVADPVTAEALDRVAGLLRLGSEPVRAWQAVAAGPLAPVAATAVRSATSGIRLAAAFERMAEEIRTECATTAATRAQRAGVAAMGPLAACFLPSFVCLGIVPVVVGIARSALGVLP